jgi:hypothetical protein
VKEKAMIAMKGYLFKNYPNLRKIEIAVTQNMKAEIHQ